MLYTYTDLRGLPIPERQIEEMLEIIGKTEDEIINFLGKSIMESSGMAVLFLESFSNVIQYFKDRR